MSPRTYCISHRKDVDGIASAAMVHAARGGGFRLTDYDDLSTELASIPDGTEEFILCDLGTDPSRVDWLSKELRGIGERMHVTYIDHHYLSQRAKQRLKSTNIRLRHDVNECSGMLTYNLFRKDLPEDARLLALYAAVTDYVDDSSQAKKMMERYDRQLVLLEATLLSYSVARRGNDYNFLERLVVELSKMTRPHAIEEVPEDAIAQAERIAQLTETIRGQAVRDGKLAYVQTDQYSTGSVAKIMLSAFEVPLGVAFREKERKGWYEVSLRGTSQIRVNLGRAMGVIAHKYGGNGGGHKLAAGGTVPKRHIVAILGEINKLL